MHVAEPRLIPSGLVEGLTASQRRAVLHFGGPALVLAGPGSGKTRVITNRVAALLAQGVRPYHILAVTFTNKAAAEMRERVLHSAAAFGTRGLTVSTFHSLCVRLLRRYAVPSGLAAAGWLPEAFTIIDTDDQSKLIKEAIKLAQLSTENFPPRSVLSHISGAKNQLVDEEGFAARAKDFHGRQLAKAYKNYQHLLRKAGAVDFDDLLMLTVRMLATHEPTRRDAQEHYRFVMVDEYQDTNAAQFLIAALIAGDHVMGDLARFASGLTGVTAKVVDRRELPAPNIMVVGDPDQSIYGWRGADINNILDFEQVFPHVTVIALGENFRSRRSILSAADRLIKVNTQRKHKPLIPTRQGSANLEVVATRDEHHEARLVVDWAKRLKQGGLPSDRPGQDFQNVEWKDIAIFYRTNSLSRVIEDAFRRGGVPYHLVRGTAFFQREEIKNAVAYLRIIANPNDAVALERIVNTPARGISSPTFSAIVATSLAEDRTVIDVLRDVGDGRMNLPEISSRARNSIAKFLATLDSWRSMLGPMNATTGEASTLRDLIENIITQSGLRQHYGKDPDDAERLENLLELINAAAEFEAAQLIPENNDPDAVFDEETAPLPGEQPALPMIEVPEMPEEVAEIPLVPAAVVPRTAPRSAPKQLTGESLFGDLFGEAEPEAAGASEDQSSDAAPDFLAMDELELTELAARTSERLPAQVASPLLVLLRRYLEQIALTADSDALNTSAGAVQLMTLHAAKGLEFPAVAMVGLEHGLLPHSRATQGFGEQANKEMEEERRLCFVGITRAMDTLLLTRAAFRSARGFSERTMPSGFLDELRGSEVTFSDQSDPFGSASGDAEMHEFLAGDLRNDDDGVQSAGARGDESQVERQLPQRRLERAGASSGSMPFAQGNRVRHPQFGEGKVVGVYPGATPRVTVEFKFGGSKTLVLQYARLTRL